MIERAPCRVDFAGGTADLWPLYLYLGGLELVHMAIDVKAEVQFKWTPAKGKKLSFTISSLDLDRKTTYSSLDALCDSLRHNTLDNPLRWINRLVHFKASQMAKLGGELELQSRSDAPPGSGLGGSSVLGIAIARGLEKLWLPKSKQSAPWTLQQQVRDLEAIEIEHPAGDQDYVPALFGGLLVFHLGPNSRSIEKLPPATAKYLGERCALLYTGKPHHSGINNWQVYTDYHNGKLSTRDALKDIVALSKRFAGALRKKETKLYPELINQEWELRQELSHAVRAPVLDEAWTYAQTLGAIARKACGSGGGGSLLVYFKDPVQKNKALKTALPRSDWKWLDCKPA